MKLRGTYTLEVAQPLDVVRRRLQLEVTKGWFAAIRNRSRFWGSIEDEKVKLYYTGCRKGADMVKRNNFCPDFYGTMHETAGRTTLRFKWRIPIFHIVFMTIWFSVVGFALFMSVMDLNLVTMLISGTMFFGGFALLVWGTRSGLKDTKAAIRETIIIPGEWWREYEGDKGDEWDV